MIDYDFTKKNIAESSQLSNDLVGLKSYSRYWSANTDGAHWCKVLEYNHDGRANPYSYGQLFFIFNSTYRDSFIFKIVFGTSSITEMNMDRCAQFVIYNDNRALDIYTGFKYLSLENKQAKIGYYVYLREMAFVANFTYLNYQVESPERQSIIYNFEKTDYTGSDMDRWYINGIMQ